MTEVGFYHLQRSALDRALPKLLERVVERGFRALVLTGSKERADYLNGLLWTYDPGSFLPHGIAMDGVPAEQPVFLTEHEENPNAASVLVLVDGANIKFMAGFDRCLDMFDGNDTEAVASARQRWKDCVTAGFNVTYWQQNDGGGWEKTAEGGGKG